MSVPGNWPPLNDLRGVSIALDCRLEGIAKGDRQRDRLRPASTDIVSDRKFSC